MLYQYLEKKGVSLYQMSKETGIPYKTLDDLKNCKTKIENSKVDTLYKISQYFEVSMEEIYTNLRRFDFHKKTEQEASTL